MASSAKMAAFVLAISLSATLVSCGDDDAEDGGSAGKGGGTAGKGGKPSTAGSNGTTAGRTNGGNAGVAGEMGAGGDASAGEAAGGSDAGGGGQGGEPGAGGLSGDGGMASGGANGVENECNSLPYGAAVFAEYVTDESPAPEGGDIVDGVYHLTALTHYDSQEASTSNDPIHSAIEFDGTAIEWSNQAKEEAATGASFTYTVLDTSIVLVNVCPTPGPGDTVGYTATENTLTLFLDAVYTYTLN